MPRSPGCFPSSRDEKGRGWQPRRICGVGLLEGTIPIGDAK
jgi:hypothetical protein